MINKVAGQLAAYYPTDHVALARAPGWPALKSWTLSANVPPEAWGEIDLLQIPTLDETRCYARGQLAQTPSLDEIALSTRQRLLELGYSSPTLEGRVLECATVQKDNCIPVFDLVAKVGSPLRNSCLHPTPLSATQTPGSDASVHRLALQGEPPVAKECMRARADAPHERDARTPRSAHPDNRQAPKANRPAP